MQTQEAETKKVKPTKKEEKEEVKLSEEEIRAETEEVMVLERQVWPKEVQEILGKDETNKHGFSKGVPYAICAYMSLARKKVAKAISLKKRVAELETAKKLSEVMAEMNPLRIVFNADKKRDLEVVEERRKMALDNAIKEINARYDLERLSIEARKPDGRFKELIMEEATAKAEYEQECKDIESSYNPVLAKIKVIEDGSENWKSKKRSSKRSAVAKQTEDA